MKVNAFYCQVCAKPLVGRSDKKFCSDYCRAQLNNEKKKLDAGEQVIQNINRVLRRNRSILKSMGAMEEFTTRKENLVLLGFEFSYFTQQVPGPDGSIYNCCYEYGYRLLPDEKVLVLNRSAYQKK
jgi:predicted nucleic acid-binding Zn ribbon protein